MTAPRRNRRRGGRSQSQRGNKAKDLWRPVPSPDAPPPIRPVADPTALINSLGPPPLHGHSSSAEYYLRAVIERAAAVATALAASANVLAEPEEE